MFFFFKQKTAYEMRISDWSSDVCSSDLESAAAALAARHATDAEIANMQAILQEGGNDPVALNLRFHDAIYSAAHNRHLIRLLRSLTDTTYLLGRSTLSSKARAKAAMQEHADIAAAIRSRNRSEERRVGKEGVRTGRSRG